MRKRDHVSWLATASLKVKAMTFMSLMALLVGASLSWYFLNQTRAIFTEELQRRALSLAINLARNSKNGILAEDPAILHQLVEGVLQEESVLFVLIADAHGKVLAQGPQIDEAKVVSSSFAFARRHAMDTATRVVVPLIHYHEADERSQLHDAPIYHAVAPVETIEPTSRGNEEQSPSAQAPLNGEPVRRWRERRVKSRAVIYHNA